MKNFMKEEIKTEKAPLVVGPYSQAVKVGNLIFCSGQIGIDPSTGNLVEGGIEAQTEQILKNLSAVLEAAGLTLETAVRTDIFITSMNDYSKVNEIYGRYFEKGIRPARVTVEVSKLPKNALIEISCIAHI